MADKNMEPKVKSLAKAMKVLECFSVRRPELGITELAQMLDLPKSTVHNIISTFAEMGYIACNEDNGKYYLGVKLLHFSYIINTHMGIRKLFLPYLQKIAANVGETVYLGVPHGSEVLYIESLSSGGVAHSRNILGETAPMYCTGIGKAMLAFLGDRDGRIDRTDFISYTENTITGRETLLGDLDEVRRRGYAIDDMEHEYGVKCVAVPVFGQDGGVIAAISVSAPSLRMGSDNIARYARMIRAELEPIQRVL